MLLILGFAAFAGSLITTFVPTKHSAAERVLIVNEPYEIVIPGNPRGKGVARVWNGRGVTPAATRQYMALIKGIAANTFESPLEGPLQVEILAVTTLKSHKGEPAFRAKKPDADNIAKAVLDGMTGIAYLDDNQVSILVVKKLQQGGSEPGYCRVWVSKLDQ